MIALLSQKEVADVGAPISAICLGKTVVISSEVKPLEGFVRIPLRMAERLLSRDSTCWITPKTASEGLLLFDKMNKEWVDYIASQDNVDAPPGIIVVSDDVHSKRKRKTLIDVRRERTRKNRW